MLFYTRIRLAIPVNRKGRRTHERTYWNYCTFYYYGSIWYLGPRSFWTKGVRNVFSRTIQYGDLRWSSYLPLRAVDPNQTLAVLARNCRRYIRDNLLQEPMKYARLAQSKQGSRVPSLSKASSTIESHAGFLFFRKIFLPNPPSRSSLFLFTLV